MGIFNFFKKSSSVSNSNQEFRLANFMNYLQNKGWYNVTSALAMRLYDKNSALADSCDSIASEIKSIVPVIKNSNDELSYSHKVLDLLKKPNPGTDYGEFIEALALNKLLTNNIFITAYGNIKFMPTELYSTPSTAISWNGSGENYYFDVFAPNALLFLNSQYKYDRDSGRYFDNNALSELVQMKGFVNYTTSGGYVATSKLSSILYELEVLNNGNNHNLSLLLNGVNLSGVFNVDTEDQKSIEKFKKDVASYFGGSGNAGKYLVSKGKSIEFSPIQMKNKDMQQLENVQEARKVIYDRFQIPTPMRDQSVQTYSNFNTAQYVFYDKAVLPCLNDIFRGLTKFFVNRNVLKPDEVITYDPTSIPALQTRFNEEIKLRKDIGVNTNNELRDMLGYDGLDPANDVLYQPMSEVPVGSSVVEDPEDDELKMFVNVLRKSGMSNDKIAEKVKKHYGNSNQ